MYSKEFNRLKNNIFNHFRNREKWKENEDGTFTYYKGKRNLKALGYVLDIAFGDEFEIESKEYFHDNEGNIIGGSITGSIYVDADFNGGNQGTKGASVWLKFTLCEDAYFYNQADQLENLY